MKERPMRILKNNYSFSVYILFLLMSLGTTATSRADNYPSTLSYSKDRGFYSEPLNVILSVDTTGAVIKYTLDGSDPVSSDNATTASAPVTVHVDPADTSDRFLAPAVCLRAVAFIGEEQITRVKTHTYLYIDQVVALSPDGVRPGSRWPWPKNWGSSDQYIDYGMDPDVCNDFEYSDLIPEALTSIPSFSIVTDLGNLFDPDSGIFMNAFERNLEWERPASIELLNPDGTQGFQINGGIRIRGGWSRHQDNPKHAFRLFFREEYGEKKLQYPLFGDEGAYEYDKVDLRTSQNYAWAYKGEGDDSGKYNTMLRDVFSRDTQRDMGMPYTRSRYYHLYLNGVYWGLFQTQERVDAEYAETYMGGLQENYDVIKKDPEGYYSLEANDGVMDTYNELWAIAKGGFETDEDYFRIQGLNPDGTNNPDYPVMVDLDNLIAYMLCTYYVGDYDGPISAFMRDYGINNIFAVYNRVNPDGFKFFRHDAEHSMFLYEGAIPGAGIDRTGPFFAGTNIEQFNPQWLHQQLTNNPDYLVRFADRVYENFFNDGPLTPDAVTARLQTRRDQIEKAIIAESARWGDSKVSSPRTYRKDWVPAVEFLFNDYAPIRTAMVLDQFISKGWYPEVNPPVFSTMEHLVSYGTPVAITAEAGSIYYTLDGSDPLGSAFRNELSPTALLYADSLILTENITLTARTKNGTDWSPLRTCKYWIQESLHELRITEINYHPLDDGQGENNDGNFEFIEIKNLGSADYDMSGIQFTRGIHYTFPNGTILNGGAYLVLASNAEAFNLRYQFAPDGIYEGKLDNSGEQIVLESEAGDTLVNIRYDDKYPWPFSADGDGYSLVPRSTLPDVDFTKGANWTHSACINGSPGYGDPVDDENEYPEQPKTVSGFCLYQNFPNPFNSMTTLRFDVPAFSHVTITIYNLLGQKTTTLVNSSYFPGTYNVTWRADQQSAGMYICRIQAGNYTETKKCVLLK